MKDFGLKVECPVYGVGNWCNFDNLNPKLITYSSVKGLEFDIVFAAGTSSFGDFKKDKNLAFVAVTRAKKQLYITGQNRISPIFFPPTHDTNTTDDLPSIDSLFH